LPMSQLAAAAADLRIARSNLVDRIDRARLNEDARQVVQEHLYALERISGQLGRLELARGAWATSNSRLDPVLDLVRCLRFSTNMTHREIEMRLDQIDSTLRALTI
jgi:hypothetical protein